MRIRIASRGSALARWQAEHVGEALTSLDRDLEAVIETHTTRGDRESGPLADIGVKGLFTAEVDRALREGDADLAVHSFKDLPIETPEDLVIAAVPRRGPVEDVLISRGRVRLAELPPGATVGTSSPRRAAFLRRVRPDLRIGTLRGNVPTRLQRVAEGRVDATVMARAGLLRLGLEREIADVLEGLLPAPAQGALAVVARRDSAAADLAARLDHEETRRAAEAERAVLQGLGGGCSIPLGVLAVRVGSKWRLSSCLTIAPDLEPLTDTREGADLIRLALDCAAALRAKGAPT
ncbi:MAG: hydroxymethylbilane synthase [Candidatus Eiseniibacteriota bacterium]